MIEAPKGIDGMGKSFLCGVEDRKPGREDIKQHPDIGISFAYLQLLKQANTTYTTSCRDNRPAVLLARLRLPRSVTARQPPIFLHQVTRLARDLNLTIPFITRLLLHTTQQHLHICLPPHIDFPLAPLLRRMVWVWDFLTFSQLAPKAKRPQSATLSF